MNNQTNIIELIKDQELIERLEVLERLKSFADDPVEIETTVYTLSSLWTRRFYHYLEDRRIRFEIDTACFSVSLLFLYVFLMETDAGLSFSELSIDSCRDLLNESGNDKRGTALMIILFLSMLASVGYQEDLSRTIGHFEALRQRECLQSV